MCRCIKSEVNNVLIKQKQSSTFTNRALKDITEMTYNKFPQKAIFKKTFNKMKLLHKYQTRYKNCQINETLVA